LKGKVNRKIHDEVLKTKREHLALKGKRNNWAAKMGKNF